MSTKTISINPAIFSVGGQKTRKNKDSKTPKEKKVTPLISANVLKKKFLHRIQQQRQNEQKQQQSHATSATTTTETPINELTQSIDLFSSLQQSVKNTSQLQLQPQPLQLQPQQLQPQPLQLQPQPLQPQQLQPQQLQLQPQPPQPQQLQLQPQLGGGFIAETPQYGSLKGGTLPTYRQYQQSQRNRHSTTTAEPTPQPQPPQPPQQQITPPPPQPPPQPQQQTTPSIARTTTRKYTLGKKGNKVSVFLNNNKTRKATITEAHRGLRQIPMEEVKHYCIQHNLLQVGSNAPNDIIRKIYENAKLSGDIHVIEELPPIESSS